MHRLREKIFSISLNTLFFILLFLLIGYVLYPYTSFYYRKPPVAPFALRLNVSSVELEEGETFRIYVVGPKKKAKFTTREFKVIELSSGGTIRARRKGKAVVRVQVGDKVLKCKVTVVKKK